MSVKLKAKPLAQFVFGATSLAVLYRILETIFSRGTPTLWEFTALVSAFVWASYVLFILPSCWVILDKEGFRNHVGVGLLWHELKTLKDKRLTWNQVTSVRMVTPKWWPIRFIAVVGSDGKRIQMFPLGTLVSNTTAGLQLVAKLVDKRKLDDDVLALVKQQ